MMYNMKGEKINNTPIRIGKTISAGLFTIYAKPLAAKKAAKAHINVKAVTAPIVLNVVFFFDFSFPTIRPSRTAREMITINKMIGKDKVPITKYFKGLIIQINYSKVSVL
ncbi:MAG: hypothetical protein PHE89_01215 [Alphaproteobacteria bacterium]|nr:hypothetical protein [Alphaproteobacteria bacterium]